MDLRGSLAEQRNKLIEQVATGDLVAQRRLRRNMASVKAWSDLKDEAAKGDLAAKRTSGAAQGAEGGNERKRKMGQSDLGDPRNEDQMRNVEQTIDKSHAFPSIQRRGVYRRAAKSAVVYDEKDEERDESASAYEPTSSHRDSGDEDLQDHSRKLSLPRKMAHRKGRTTQLARPMSLSEHVNEVTKIEASLASRKTGKIDMINLCDSDDEAMPEHVSVAETRDPSRRAEHVKMERGAKVKVEKAVGIIEGEDDEDVKPIPQASPPDISSARPVRRSHDDDVEEMELELAAARK